MKPAKSDTQPSPHFLMESATVDYAHTDIRKLASALSSDDPTATARRCFEWVRDHIEHSMDFHREEVTCAASNVSQQGTGLCTAKSHLLVALWRANQIPAGFCYQRFITASRPIRMFGQSLGQTCSLPWRGGKAYRTVSEPFH